MAALDFPTAPVNGQLYPDPVVPGVPQYYWDGEKWTMALPSGGATGDFLPLAGGSLTGSLYITTPAENNVLFDVNNNASTDLYVYGPGGTFELDRYASVPNESANFRLNRSRGTLDGGTAPLHLGDWIGWIGFGGEASPAVGGVYDWPQSAGVGAIVDGAPSWSSLPTALTFNTGNNGDGVERLRITSGGTVNIGLTTPFEDEYTQLVMGNATRAFETSVWGDVTGYVELDLVGWGNGGFGGGVLFAYSRGTRDVPLPVQVGDETGTIGYGFQDLSGGNRVSAQFKAIVDAAPTANGVPTGFVFTTGATGNAGTERLRIASSGKVKLTNPVAITDADQVPTKAYVDSASSGKQAADAGLTALAALDATSGLLEQTALDTFTKRALGVAAATSVLTRADGDGRYATQAAATTYYGAKTISTLAPSGGVDGDVWYQVV